LVVVRKCNQAAAAAAAACLQVLRQQGLDYKAWDNDQREKYEEHFKQLFVSVAISCLPMTLISSISKHI
jgi:hypothetical protein